MKSVIKTTVQFVVVLGILILASKFAAEESKESPYYKYGEIVAK